MSEDTKRTFMIVNREELSANDLLIQYDSLERAIQGAQRFFNGSSLLILEVVAGVISAGSVVITSNVMERIDGLEPTLIPIGGIEGGRAR